MKSSVYACLRFLGYLGLLAAAACGPPEVPDDEIPCYIQFENARVLTPEGDTLDDAIPVVLALAEGDNRLGYFYTPAEVPSLERNTTIFARAAVRINDSYETYAPYSPLLFDQIQIDLGPNEDTVFRPLYRYQTDTNIVRQPVFEDFESEDLAFEVIEEASTATLERSTESPYLGDYCGVVRFDSTRRGIDLITRDSFPLPYATTWLEVRYKGNIRFGVRLQGESLVAQGSIVNTNRAVPQGPFDPGQWQTVYINVRQLTSELIENTDMRLIIEAVSDGQERVLYLDHIRLLHFF